MNHNKHLIIKKLKKEIVIANEEKELLKPKVNFYLAFMSPNTILIKVQ